MNITVVLTQKPAAVPNTQSVKFGSVFTDHMFLMDCYAGIWQNPRIVPFAPLQISPANATLHYGQAVFEGLKAYRHGNQAVLFRAKEHLLRLNRSAKILDIPQVPLEVLREGLFKLLDIDKRFIPNLPGHSLYIRPFIFANDSQLGVNVSERYVLAVIMSPVAAYYKIS